MTKTCTECLTEKTLQEFALDKSGKFGRRSKCKVCQQEAKKAKRAVYNAYDAIRRAKSKCYLTQAQREQVKAIYASAAELRARGFDVVVDHLDPVNGKIVCGFTHPDNLAIISTAANLIKSNTFQPYRVTFLADGTTVTTLV